MKAIIKTNDRNLFYSLLNFLRTIPVIVETKEDEKLSKKTNNKQKKTNLREYEGILSPLNLDIESELIKMRNGWKRTF